MIPVESLGERLESSEMELAWWWDLPRAHGAWKLSRLSVGLTFFPLFLGFVRDYLYAPLPYGLALQAMGSDFDPRLG